MYSANVVSNRESVILNKLQPGKVLIKGPEPTLHKKYRDWTGKYFNAEPLKTANAYNRPLTKIVYDTWADTRAIWLKP